MLRDGNLENIRLTHQSIISKLQGPVVRKVDSATGGYLLDSDFFKLFKIVHLLV